MAKSGDTVDTRTETPPSEAVVEAVADAEGIDLADLRPPEYEPLVEVVDPEALDRLFRQPGDSRRAGTVRFTYCGYEVTVTDGGSVRLDRP